MVLRTVGFQRGLQDSCCENGHFQCFEIFHSALVFGIFLCWIYKNVKGGQQGLVFRTSCRQGGACNSAPNGPIDPKFCMWGTFDFCQGQGHMTSTEAKPVLASKCDWPLFFTGHMTLTWTKIKCTSHAKFQAFLLLKTF